uniref:hypothetical protein n=1 Tax=Streptomyces sp. DSM 41634 TaxID=3448656 RepID=UPI0040402A37
GPAMASNVREWKVCSPRVRGGAEAPTVLGTADCTQSYAGSSGSPVAKQHRLMRGNWGTRGCRRERERTSSD